MKGRSGRENIIHKKDVGIFRNSLKRPCLKGPGHISCFILDREFCLGAGSAGTIKDVGTHLRPEASSKDLSYDLSLVIPSGPKPGPMQRNRNHGIHI